MPTLLASLILAGVAFAAAGQVGEAAPPYEARLIDSSERVTLSEQRGKAVLLNKWATWCKPCVKEMPELERLYRAHRSEGFVVIGVSIDRGDADGPTASVAKERGVTYPLWRDSEDDFTQVFRSTGVPESILVDREGTVVYRWRGALEASPEAERLIESALASTGEYEAVARAVTEESTNSIGFALAALAGLLSFLSPCVLPLVPGYVAFVTGVSGRPGGGPSEVARHRALANGGLFIAGFSTIFIALGASATALGSLLRDHADTLARVGGVILLVLGLHLVGLFRIPGFERDVRALDRVAKRGRLGYASSYAVGVAFGAGWTPCIGPVLAGILTLAATTGSVAEGVALLTAYSLGLAVPFLLATVALDRFLVASKGTRRFMPWINRISGAVLLVLGIILVSGAMTRLSAWFSQFTPAWLE